MQQEFKQFRKLLDMAICHRTQAQFAKDANISAEHLNRLINSPKISRPTNATLKKIAAIAENGVTYKDLIDALDSEDPDYKKVDYTQLKYQEAVKDFSPTFKEKVKQSYAVLAKIMAQEQPAFASSLSAYMECRLQKYREACRDAKIDPIEISYYICEDHYKYLGNKFSTDTDKQNVPIEFCCVLLSSAEGKETVESEMILYITQTPLMTAQFPYIVAGASMAVEDLFELYGLYPEMCGDIEYGADMDLEAALAQPFYLDFNEPDKIAFNKEDPEKADFNTENLLQQLLYGPIAEIPTCTTGLGFYIDKKCLEKFYSFIKNHKDAFLSEYHEDLDYFQKVSDMLEKSFAEIDALPEDEAQERIKDFITQLKQFFPLTETEESVISYVISIVMCKETGFDFQVFCPCESEKYSDILSTKTCIMLTDETMLQHNIHKTTVLNLLAKYGKELGIRYLGEIRYVWMQYFFKKTETYSIRTEEPKPIERETINTDLWKDISEKPKQTGLYKVLLKDGRFLHCIYLDGHDVWLKRHKEWSNMIDKWNPEAIRAFDTEKKPTADADKNTAEEIDTASKHDAE